MEFVPLDKYVRLCSMKNSYLCAERDKVSVCQATERYLRGTIWKVEYSEKQNFFRLRSRYGRYLGASGSWTALGLAGHEVVQRFLASANSSIDWQATRREGHYVTLSTDDNKVLQANTYVFPWRRSVTHNGLENLFPVEWRMWRFEEVLPDPRSNNRLAYGEQVVVFEVATSFVGKNILHQRTCFVFEGSTINELGWMMEAAVGIKHVNVCTWNDTSDQLILLSELKNDAIIEVVAVGPPKPSGLEFLRNQVSQCMFYVSVFIFIGFRTFPDGIPLCEYQDEINTTKSTRQRAP